MRKSKSLKIMLSVAIILFIGKSMRAQENPLDTLANSVFKIKEDVDLMKRVKMSGYLQTQFQLADSNGTPSYAGGDFNAHTDKRFMLRRARVKISYETPLTQYVFQIDATEKGFNIKDLYLKFTPRQINFVSLTVGCMNRPFGFEIGYSSSMRESPERGRMSQIIFPNERDLGAMLTFQLPKTSRWNFLKLEAGMYNGTSSSATDFDYKKDFIGRFRMDKSNKSEKINYGLGISYYNGGVRQGNNNICTIASDNNGINGYVLNSDTAHYGKIAKREYIGADFQINIDFSFGLTTLRAEYIQGQQPGTSSTSKSPTSQPTSDTYLRSFNGAYFYFLQNIGKSKFQFVAKYDWYDPNTDVAGNDIGKTLTPYDGKTYKKTNSTDIKYSTVGLGLAYRWDNNIKITAYYDLVNNETSDNLKGFNRNLKDNVFTLRVQYKF